MTGSAGWPSSPANADRPLAGVRVLDLSRILAGPFCSMILADLGADVVKVEPPMGDETRRWGPPFVDGTAAYYFGANRNKWHVALNLKDPVEFDLCGRLLDEATVVIHNFTPQTAKRLGVDFESVASRNPGVIYLSLSAFGPEDPLRKGYDIVAQAFGGVMAITGDAGGSPAKVGVPISDLSAGLFGAVAVIAELRRLAEAAEHRPRHLEVSLYDSTLSLLVNQSMNWLLSAVDTPRMGSEHPVLAPYGSYSALDGDIVIAVGSDLQFERLAQCLGVAGLSEDARFRTNAQRVANRAELRVQLETVLRTHDRAHWLAIFDREGIPSAPVRSVGEALQSQETKTLTSVTHDTLGHVPQVALPIRIDGQYLQPYLAPGILGEHTSEIFPEQRLAETVNGAGES